MTIIDYLTPLAEDVQDVNGPCFQGTVPVSSAGTHGGMRLTEKAPKNTRKSPLISVINAVYSDAVQLPATIENVVQQKQDDVEYIVVDGGSTDGTRAVLQSFNNARDNWVSETDASIYDAMNKGINLACGRFIYHLNIGERLLRIPEIFTESVSENVICIAGVAQTSANGLYIPFSGVELRHHATYLSRLASELI